MRIFAMLLTVLASAEATTLQRLSMADMIQQSTAIVRATVTGSYTAFRGPDIYTSYQLRVLETAKTSGTSAATQQIEVAVPGGVAQGVRQAVAGAPTLTVGGEYVLFLWTSRSGMTQVIGLSQGLFSAVRTADGSIYLVRPAAAATVLDAKGNIVSDPAVTLNWGDLRSQIQQQLGTGK